MHPARTLTTDHLHLTPLIPGDAQVFCSLLSDPDVRHHLGGPVPADQHDARFAAYLTPPPEIGLWAIRTAQHTDLMGLITLAPHHDRSEPEVSFELRPIHWRQGHATKALRAVIDHALIDLGHACVIAETQRANTASCRLLTRLGLSVVDTVERFGAAQLIYATSAAPP